jgi:hypothetical protein
MAQEKLTRRDYIDLFDEIGAAISANLDSIVAAAVPEGMDAVRGELSAVLGDHNGVVGRVRLVQQALAEAEALDPTPEPEPEKPKRTPAKRSSGKGGSKGSKSSGKTTAKRSSAKSGGTKKSSGRKTAVPA